MCSGVVVCAGVQWGSGVWREWFVCVWRWCVQVCSGVVVCGGIGLCVFGGGVCSGVGVCVVGWVFVAGMVCVWWWWRV